MRPTAASTLYHSAPGNALPFFLLVTGIILGFVLLVAAMAHVANLRTERREGRSDAFTYPDHADHARADGGSSQRPWEDMYRRRGVDAAAELAAAEAAGDVRRERTAHQQVPLAVNASNARIAPDAAPTTTSSDPAAPPATS